MAKVNKPISIIRIDKPKKNNKGIHSKKKASKLKTSKNYKKRYNRQGK